MDNTDEQFARGMRITALVTFLTGTVIFAAYYFFGGWLLLLGYGFIVVAALVNLSLFSIGLSEGLKNRNRSLLFSAAIMLINLPVLVFYVWYSLTYLGAI